MLWKSQKFSSVMSKHYLVTTPQSSEPSQDGATILTSLNTENPFEHSQDYWYYQQE